jgi:hypothetical protein
MAERHPTVVRGPFFVLGVVFLDTGALLLDLVLKRDAVLPYGADATVVVAFFELPFLFFALRPPRHVAGRQ